MEDDEDEGDEEEEDEEEEEETDYADYEGDNDEEESKEKNRESPPADSSLQEVKGQCPITHSRPVGLAFHSCMCPHVIL